MLVMHMLKSLSAGHLISKGILRMPRYKKKIHLMSMPAELYILQFSFRPCPEVISESAIPAQHWFGPMLGCSILVKRTSRSGYKK